MIILYHRAQAIIDKKERAPVVIQTDNRIKKLRTASGMTQSDLARLMSVTRSSVNAWDMGISAPTAAKLVELSQLFHVSTDYLLGLEQREMIELDSFSEEQKGILYALAAYFQKQNGTE